MIEDLGTGATLLQTAIVAVSAFVGWLLGKFKKKK